MKLEQQLIIKYIKEYIINNQILENNIISIYSMGSFKKNENYNDVDLNFFIKKNSADSIKEIRKMIDYFLQKYNTYLDINVIDSNMIDNNFLTSKLFIHRNRHSMLLNELTCLKSLIYGEDILKDLKYSIEDIMIESLKLSLTIRHTICKLYMKEKIDDKIEKTIKKNCRYAIEFYLLFKGIKNPYQINIDDYINKYTILSKNKRIVRNIYRKATDDISFDEYYNFIINIGNCHKKELLYIINNNIVDKYYNIDILKEKYEMQF